MKLMSMHEYPDVRGQQPNHVASRVRCWTSGTPGLFKVEWCGDGFIGLCSKTYNCFGFNDKFSTKGLSKRQNVINKESFPTVLTDRRSGFRVYVVSVCTILPC